MDLVNLSSNWKKLQATLKSENPTDDTSNDRKRKRSQVDLKSKKSGSQSGQSTKKQSFKAQKKQKLATSMETRIEQKLDVTSKVNAGLSENVEVGKYVALDCEMVGVGAMGAESALARVSIVNYNGEQVYDSYVLQKEEVIDWRTPVSGIRPIHMKEARTLEEVQKAVSELIKERIVVGHALRHDFKALLLDHPLRDIRDTSKFGPYRKIAGGTPKLSLLASQLLGLDIQGGEHSSLEDARACMMLFKRDKDAFEGGKSKPKGRRR